MYCRATSKFVRRCRADVGGECIVNTIGYAVPRPRCAAGVTLGGGRDGPGWHLTYLALLVRVALVATLPRRVHGFVPAPGQSVRVWVWLWTWMLGRVPVSVPAFNIGADVCVGVVCRR